MWTLAMVPTQVVPDLPSYGFTPDLGGLLGVVLIVLLPVFVGLVTRTSTSSAIQGLLLLFLAAVKVVIEAWLAAVNTDTTFEALPVIYTVLINFVIAVAVHYGLWKPTGVSAGAQRAFTSDAGQRRA